MSINPTNKTISDKKSISTFIKLSHQTKKFKSTKKIVWLTFSSVKSQILKDEISNNENWAKGKKNHGNDVNFCELKFIV